MKTLKETIQDALKWAYEAGKNNKDLSSEEIDLWVNKIYMTSIPHAVEIIHKEQNKVEKIQKTINT